MLKKRIKALTEVDEKFRGLYKQDGDAFVLDVEVEGGEGGDSAAKLAEFRANNIKLQKQLADAAEAMKKFEGINPEDARQAADVLSKLKADEERELIKQGKLDEVFERRSGAMKSDYEKRLSAITAARDEAEKRGSSAIAQLSGIKVSDRLSAALAKAGTLRKGADMDALNRGRSIFKLAEDDKLTPDAGGSPLFGKKGEPLTPEEWANELVETAPYLWEATGGGGSKGGAAPVAGPGGKKILRNPTPQEMGAHLEGIADGTVVVIRG